MNENIYYKDEMFTIYGTRTAQDHCEFRIYYHGEWIWVKDTDTYPVNDKYHYMSESEKK